MKRSEMVKRIWEMIKHRDYFYKEDAEAILSAVERDMQPLNRLDDFIHGCSTECESEFKWEPEDE